ncbi:FUSC family protein [Legionella waltersii]|uniref:Integral membrane bound transporter domain-containing protein n=1 Tax=Legionella waltersii TaxID=66969 RepID=A0A0W1A5F8_9GAMM|nr:FUSC family protein [Legionella waltersii]KTD76574.1 hypothetical protein Lwal_2296 [Legionella waltersii]SNU94434.1 Uncharacterised protein [Legionella waltersii]
MQQTSTLRKKLDYARFIHLLIMFMVAMLIFLFSTFPERLWVLITVLSVSAGAEPGLILIRAIHRAGGTILALILLIPLLYLLQLNYRLIPILFIFSLIGLSVSTLNNKRYDISVFFITLFVFFLLAQTNSATSVNGPFEMVLNRSICTVIGIFIVLVGDFFLFNAYRYSHRLYLFHQMMVYNFLNECVQNIMRADAKKLNTFLFVEKLRSQAIEHFLPISTSSENLKLDYKTTLKTKQKVDDFQQTTWEIRRLVFALCISKFVLHSPKTTKQHLLRFNLLMKKARNDFIRYNRH